MVTVKLLLFLLLLLFVVFSTGDCALAQATGEGACTFNPCQPSVPIQPNSSLMTDQNGQLTFQPLPSATLPAYAQCVSNAVAGGSSDKLTVPKLPCTPTTTVLNVTASAPNATTSPTLQAAGMRALPIVRASGQPLAVGDIPAAGAKFQVTTDGKKWYLMANGPGTGGGGGVPPARRINTTSPLVGGGALTGDLNLAISGPANVTSFPVGDIPRGNGASPWLQSSIVDAGNGVVVGNATGGGQGAGTINAQNLLVNGTPVGTATGNVTTAGGTTNRVPQWLNSTGLSTGLPVGTSGASTIMESNTSGSSPFPVNTTNGVFSGQVSVTIPTGTPPFVISSSTAVPNLNASLLNGATFHSPGPIGDSAAWSGFFTGLSAAGTFTNAGAAVGTCASGAAFDSLNNLVKIPCPSIAGGISGLTTGQVTVASGPATIGSSLPLTGSVGAAQVVSATTAAKTNGNAVCWQGNNAVDCGTPPGIGALSGMTPGQVPIAASSNTVTSSQPESGNGGYVATTTSATKANGNAACWQSNNLVDCGGPIGSGSGLSGMTVGQIPVAATPTTATSSIPYGTTGNNTLVENDATGHISPNIIPNTTVTGGSYTNPTVTFDAAGRATSASSNAITLNPGLCSGTNCSTYNSGSQTLSGTTSLSTQFILRAISGAGTTTLASTDGAYCNMPTVAGVTVRLPAPGALGTSSFAMCYDNSHSFAVTTASGEIYGCGQALASSMTGVTFDAQFLTDGTNWKCAGGAGGGGGGTVGGSGLANTVPLWTSGSAVGNSEMTDAAAGGVVVGAATGGQKGAGTVNTTGIYVNGASVGAAVLISTQTPSGGNITFTGGNFSNSYNSLFLNCRGIKIASNAGNTGIGVIIGESGGWQTSGNYSTATIGSTTTTNDNGLIPSFQGSTTVAGSIKMYLDSPGSTTDYKMASSIGTFWSDYYSALEIINGGGYWNADTNAITGIQIYAFATTISSGTCSLWGMI